MGEGRLREAFGLDPGHVESFADKAFRRVVEPHICCVGVFDGVEGRLELNLFTVSPGDRRREKFIDKYNYSRLDFGSSWTCH